MSNLWPLVTYLNFDTVDIPSIQNEITERFGLDLAKNGEADAIKYAKQRQNSTPVAIRTGLTRLQNII